MTSLRPPFAALAAALIATATQAQTAMPPRPAASAPAPKKVATAPLSPRLEACEKQAGDRTGDARKSYVQACLKPASAQQSKMKECNVAAKGKKGDERRTFMSECLRKKKS